MGYGQTFGICAVLSGNTDLLEKAKLEKKIFALESERKAFNRERDQALNTIGRLSLRRISIRVNCKLRMTGASTTVVQR